MDLINSIYNQNPTDVFVDQNKTRQTFAQNDATLASTILGNQTKEAELPGVIADSQVKRQAADLGAALFDKKVQDGQQKGRMSIKDFGQASAAIGEVLGKLPPEQRAGAAKAILKEFQGEHFYQSAWDTVDPQTLPKMFSDIGNGILSADTKALIAAQNNDTKLKVADKTIGGRYKVAELRAKTDLERAQIMANARLKASQLSASAKGTSDPMAKIKTAEHLAVQYALLAANTDDENERAQYSEASNRFFEISQTQRAKPQENAGKPILSPTVAPNVLVAPPQNPVPPIKVPRTAPKASPKVEAPAANPPAPAQPPSQPDWKGWTIK